jgi:release factor glutamine methyltransferase
MIYEPAEDSYLLESIIPKYAKNKSVLDVGTGFGILAIKSLEFGAKSVTAIDINEEAIINLKKINGRIRAIHSNLFEKVKGKFDIIICNPPYLPEDKLEDKESQKITTGGRKGDEFILKFIKQSVGHLNHNGIILLLLSSLTPQNRILNLLKTLNLKYEIINTKKIFLKL